MTSDKKTLEIRRHSLLSAIVISIALSATYGMYMYWGIYPSSAQVVTPSMAGDWVLGWQLQNPILSTIIICGGLFVLSLKIGQISSRFNLYGVNTNLAMEIYPLLVMGVMVNVNSLKIFIVATLLLYSLSRFFSAYRSSNRSGHLVSGSIAVGVAILFYPPLILLWGVMPFMLLLFERTLREVIVTTFATLIVPFMQIYSAWVIDGTSFTESISLFIEGLFVNNNFTLLDSFSGVTILMLALVLYLSINALFAISLLENTIKARRRLKVIGLYSVAIALTTALPSCDTSTFGIIALPLALLIPITLLKLSRIMAFIMYITLFIGTALSLARF